MRITGGIARGRPLAAPRGLGIRPTSDRVREAVFDLLGPGAIEGCALDLFAGTGALGIEAASRGAARVVLVDRDPRALAACRKNIAAVPERSADVRVIRADAFGFLRRGHPDLPADLVFLDPPYAFDRWPELLDALLGCGAVREGGMVVRERATRSEAASSPAWRIVRAARYGDTSVDLLVAEGRSKE